MFLSKNALKVLKYCSDSSSIPVFETSDMKLDIPEAKLRIAVEELIAKEYASEISINVYGDIQFALTYHGRDYKTYLRLDFYEALAKSVLVPITVAIITSVATTYIGGKWGNNQEINIYVTATPSNAQITDKTNVTR